jgi:anti-anti-sigma factor
MVDKPGHVMVESRRCGRVVVLAVREPEVYRADTIEQLGNELRRTIDAAGVAEAFVLDLASVRFLSSAALGLLINLRAHLMERDYQLALAGAKGEVAEVLDCTRLAEVMRVYPTAEEAVKRLGDPCGCKDE